MNVTILSYNIWGMPWGNRRIDELLLWIFNQSDAEIVCLQEVFSKYHRQSIQEKAEVLGWSVFFPDDPCWLGTCLNSFHSGSGLCILVKPSIEVLDEIQFSPYEVVDSYVEKLVSKGYFGLHLQKDTTRFTVLNTHMISDVTECSPFRLVHGLGRRLQEKQLLEAAQTIHQPVLIVGDLNQEEHHYLHRMYQNEEYTFPATQEQLDHVVCLMRDHHIFQVQRVRFFHDILFSDHSPLVVTVQVSSKDKPD